MSDLNNKIAEVFAGKVVRKDLVRKVKVGAILVVVGHLLFGKKGNKNKIKNSIDKAISIACKSLAKIQIQKEMT